MKRSIHPIVFPELELGEIIGSPPQIAIVDPRSLKVDETYQRNLSYRSLELIKKIVREWTWSAFKPPIVSEDWDVIDGQHTAIAAATRGITELPVMVIDSAQIEDRAKAFVRHNRDRITVTQNQLHAALVVAGDETALTIAQICERAGVKILKYPPQMGNLKPRETVAVGSIKSVLSRRYAKGTREVLEVCANTGMPITAGMIKATEHLMFSEEYAGTIDPQTITRVMAAFGDALEQEAKRYAAERSLPNWRGMASVIFMNRKKRGA